jgi:hypothetical protein
MDADYKFGVLFRHSLEVPGRGVTVPKKDMNQGIGDRVQGVTTLHLSMRRAKSGLRHEPEAELDQEGQEV